MTLNFAFWLSLVLAAAGCTGLWAAGKGKWYGWSVGLAVQPVWATYAIVTKGYGLLLTCFMYGTVNARNLWKWRQREASVKRYLTKGVNAERYSIDEVREMLSEDTDG